MVARGLGVNAENSMSHRRTKALTAFGNRLSSGPARLSQAVRQSLDPANDCEARILETQLDLVRTNVRVLDYACPLVGGMLILLHAARSSISGPLAAWAVLAVAGAANEVVLLRRPSHRDDEITHASENAKTIPFAMFTLLMGWGTFCFSLWTPSNDEGHLLTILVLACPLAAMSSMFAWHAAAGTVSVVTISAFILGVEVVSGYNKHLRLFQLLVLYVTMIAAQACMHHMRFNKARRLEQDRELLIANLREAKIEADRAREQAIAASKAK